MRKQSSSIAIIAFSMVWFCFAAFPSIAPAQISLTDGLVCYIPMDGDVNDASGNGNDGVWMNAAGAYVSGVIGQAADISDGPDYISIADPQGHTPDNMQIQGDFTAMAWFKSDWDLPGSTRKACPFGNMEADAHQSGPHEGHNYYEGWWTYMRLDGYGDNAGNIGVYIFDGVRGDDSYYQVTAENPPFNNGEWRHFAFVVDATRNYHVVYVDGVAHDPYYGLTVDFNNTDSPYPTNIGMDGGGNDNEEIAAYDQSEAAAWQVDEFAVWQRALGSAEIRRIYHAGNAGVAIPNAGLGPVLEIVNVDDRLPFPLQTKSYTYTDTATITVRNGGDEQLNLNASLSGGAFGHTEFSVTPATMQLDPGETGDFTVEWDPNPSNTGIRNPDVIIDHDGLVSNRQDPMAPVEAAASFSLGGSVLGIQDGLVCYLPMDDNVQDASGSGNHGQWIGMAGQYTGGVIGQAADIPETSGQYISIRNAGGATPDNMQIQGDWSMSGWFKTNWDGVGNRVSPCGNWDMDESNREPGFWLFLASQADGTARYGNNRMYICDGSSGGLDSALYDDEIGGYRTNDGQWHHIVYVLNATAGYFTMYMDGVRYSTDASIATDLNLAASPHPINLGCDGGGEDGPLAVRTGKTAWQIDEVAFWQRALGDGEVNMLYNDNMAGTPLPSVTPRAAMSIEPLLVDQNKSLSRYYDYSPRGWFFDYQNETATAEVTLINSGLKGLEIKNLTLGGPDADEFSVSVADTFTLNPDYNQNIVVTWTPDFSQIGERDAYLEFEHNDASRTSPIHIDLGGPTIVERDALSGNLGNNLLVHLKFDQDYQNTVDNGINGSPVNEEFLSFVPGIAGASGLQFDAGPGHVTLGTPDELNFFNGDYYTTAGGSDWATTHSMTGASDQFAISVWVRTPADVHLDSWWQAHEVEGDPANWDATTVWSSNDGFMRPIIANNIWYFSGYPGYIMALNTRPGDRIGGLRANFSDGFNNAPVSRPGNHWQQVYIPQTTPGFTAAEGPFKDGSWHQIGMNVDHNSVAALYLDGEALFDSRVGLADLGSLTSGLPTNIGADGIGGTWRLFCDMKVDDLGIWSRQLLPWEYSYIYMVGLQGFNFESDFDFSVYSTVPQEAWYLYE